MPGTSERKDRFSSLSGLPVSRLYTKDDLKDWEAHRDLGDPGEFPYTRGIHPTMYRGRLWTMRQFAGFGSAADTNARFKYLLAHGQTGLSVAFDMPTLMGLDSDVLAICETLYQDMGDPKFRPCPLLRKYVEAGWLGRKTGRGFFEYQKT